ncbi:MAG: PhoH family protein, partial [Pseudomonas neustonica]
MNAPLHIHRFSIEPVDPRRFAALCGQFDDNLHLIEQRLGIEVRNRG